MEIVYFLLVTLITGFIYMVFPLIYVKKRGKTSNVKAFGLSLLNWLILHFIFLVVYTSFFLDDVNSNATMAPALWLFVGWWYMKIPNNKSTKSIISMQSISKKSVARVSTNSIEDLEIKFSTDFKNTYRETFAREEIKFALFIFKIDQNNVKNGQLSSVVVVFTPTKNYRYFVLEKSISNSFLLCEWIFNTKNKRIKHLKYGGEY